MLRENILRLEASPRHGPRDASPAPAEAMLAWNNVGTVLQKILQHVFDSSRLLPARDVML